MVSVDNGNVVPLTAVASAADRRLMRKICSVFAIDLTEHRAIMVRMYIHHTNHSRHDCDDHGIHQENVSPQLQVETIRSILSSAAVLSSSVCC